MPTDNAGAIIAVIACLFSAGMASGLTQGLISLDYTELTIKKRSGNEKEKKYASALLPIIENHHLLLVSLMLWNAAANEILPIYLDELFPTYIAIIMSVTLVLIVGEIAPAAVMTGPKQLEIAYSLTYVVYVVLFFFFPIAYPIAKLLDYVLGVDEKVTFYNRLQLSEMVKLQHEEHLRRGDHIEHGVNIEETTMIDGVLKFRDEMVKNIMNTEVFMLDVDEKLSIETLNLIFKSGYSRIPIYERNKDDIIGILLAKDLLFIDPDDDIPIRSFMNLFGRPIHFVWPDDKLGDVLKTFRQSRSHMAAVRDVDSSGNLDPRYMVIGIVTLEDIFERILGNEILDETDIIDENNEVRKDHNRDVELLRMSILNPSLLESTKRQQLTPEEVKVISHFLLNNVTQVTQLVGFNLDAIEKLVKQSTVVEVKKKTCHDETKYLIENQLFKRGTIAHHCILILSGKVEVIVGKDQFHAEVGPWMTLGQDALITTVNEDYIPDFTAYIDSSDIRYLKIMKPSVHSPTAGTTTNSRPFKRNFQDLKQLQNRFSPHTSHRGGQLMITNSGSGSGSGNNSGRNTGMTNDTQNTSTSSTTAAGYPRVPYGEELSAFVNPILTPTNPLSGRNTTRSTEDIEEEKSRVSDSLRTHSIHTRSPHTTMSINQQQSSPRTAHMSYEITTTNTLNIPTTHSNTSSNSYQLLRQDGPDNDYQTFTSSTPPRSHVVTVSSTEPLDLLDQDPHNMPFKPS